MAGSARGSRAPAWEELWVVWCFGVTPAGTGLSAGPSRPSGLLFPLPDGALDGAFVLSPAQRPGTVLHPSPLLTKLSAPPDVFRNLSALLPALVASGTTQAAAPLLCLVARLHGPTGMLAPL